MHWLVLAASALCGNGQHPRVTGVLVLKLLRGLFDRGREISGASGITRLFPLQTRFGV